MKHSQIIWISGSAALVVLLLCLNVLCGSVRIAFSDMHFLFNASATDATAIILQQRLVSALAALLCGGALAVCGLLMQTFFRNPLADPFILGISSGSGLGVALLLLFLSGGFLATLHHSVFFEWLLIGSAAAGSALVLLLLLVFSRFTRSTASLLICGVLLGSLAAALVALVQVFVSKENIQFIFFWNMSGFRQITWRQLLVMACLILPAIVLALGHIRHFNAYLLGENYATDLGIPVQYTRRLLLLLCSVLAGGVVAFAGPVGFVGLMAPHAARLLLRTSDHRRLLPLSAMLGALLCLLCNFLSSGFLFHRQWPLNVFASFIGVPFMLLLILRSKKMVAYD